MARPRVIPGDDQLRRMVERGMTHVQIAEQVSKETGVQVSRSTISAAISRAGLSQRIRYSSTVPWSPIKTEHNHHYALEMLRVAARIEAGDKVPAARLDRFNSWERRLRESDAVVAYRYNSPDGFYYVPRRPEDGDGLIRIPD